MLALSSSTQSHRLLPKIFARPIPKELLILIASYLDTPSIARLAVCCRESAISLPKGSYRFQVSLFNSLMIKDSSKKIVSFSLLRIDITFQAKVTSLSNHLVPHIEKIASSGCVELLRIAQTSPRMTNDDYTKAIEAATRNERRAVIEFLGNGELSEDSRGRCVLFASKFSDLAFMKSLLAKGSIPMELRGLAVANAAGRGYFDHTRLLLDHGEISMERRESAIILTAREGHLACMQLLLKDKKISIKSRGEAVKGGYSSCCESLLQNGKISDNDRNEAVIAAAKAGRILCLEILLKDKAIPNDVIGLAVVESAYCGYILCIRLLLKYKKIPDELRGRALCNALMHGGHFSIVQTLLASGDIPDKRRDDAFILAARKGNLPAIQALLAGLIKKPNSFEFALSQAKAADVITYLQTWKPEESKKSL